MSFEVASDDLNEKYLSACASPESKSFSENEESPRVSSGKKKGIKGLLTKKKAFDDLTNQSPSKDLTSPLKQSPAMKSPAKEPKEDTKSRRGSILYSMTGRKQVVTEIEASAKETEKTLASKKRKELSREIMVLNDRVAYLEAEREKSEATIKNLRTDLVLVTEERDAFEQENKRLKSKVDELQPQLDRYVSRKFKQFVAKGNYIPGKDAYQL